MLAYVSVVFIFVFQLCFGIYVATSKSGLRYIIVKALLKMFKSFYHKNTKSPTKEGEDDKKKVMKNYLKRKRTSKADRKSEKSQQKKFASETLRL